MKRKSNICIVLYDLWITTIYIACNVLNQTFCICNFLIIKHILCYFFGFLLQNQSLSLINLAVSCFHWSTWPKNKLIYFILLIDKGDNKTNKTF